MPLKLHVGGVDVRVGLEVKPFLLVLTEFHGQATAVSIPHQRVKGFYEIVKLIDQDVVVNSHTHATETEVQLIPCGLVGRLCTVAGEVDDLTCGGVHGQGSTTSCDPGNEGPGGVHHQTVDTGVSIVLVQHQQVRVWKDSTLTIQPHVNQPNIEHP
ncbi:hypothetical protein D3C78_1527340 [compost metagenome]